MDSTIIGAITLGLLAIYMAVRLVSGKNQNSALIAAEIRGGALVIDVRSPAEFGDGHFNGAVNIPLDELLTRLSELGSDKTRSLVVYCASGARAGKASRQLKQAGFTKVLNAGGLFNLPRE